MLRIFHIAVKEIAQLLRDPHVRFRLTILPLIEILILGYAATMEIRTVPMAVLDLDHTRASRELIDDFVAGKRFRITRVLARPDEIAGAINSGAVTMVLRVDAGFAKELHKGATAPIQIILDGADSNSALITMEYVGTVTGEFAKHYTRLRIEQMNPALAPVIPNVELEERMRFNPNLYSRWFSVPGMIGMVTMIMVIGVTAYTIVHEREKGTLEQLMVTPLRRSELLIGKIIPLFGIGAINVAIMCLLATWGFGLPFRGNIGVLALGSTTFLLSCVGIGLMISTICSTGQQAFTASFAFCVMAVVFSGFISPIAVMPAALKIIPAVNPFRYYLEILLGTFLKGVGLAVVWPSIIALAAMATLALSFSIVRLERSFG